MEALRGSGVTMGMRDAAEQTTVTAPLNPLASEFVPSSLGGPSAALNPLAKEFLPVAAPALNPLAKEFVPPRRVEGGPRELSADALEFVVTPPAGVYVQDPTFVGYPAVGAYDPTFVGYPAVSAYDPTFLSYPAVGAYDLRGNTVPRRTWRKKVSNYSQHGKARFSHRVQRIHKEEYVRRTIYITNVDPTVTEEMLAALFGSCGIVIDCRLCGDPNSGFRFAFVEFQYQASASDALHLDGTMIGSCHLMVAPSRTAIMPIRYSYLPQSEEEKERSSRTVYCTNIQKTVTPLELVHFCQRNFGLVSRLKLLGHDNHATQIAFIEFEKVSGAIVALACSGIFAKGLPMRVIPSKTPIRDTFLRQATP